jgi:hypothetical protein
MRILLFGFGLLVISVLTGPRPPYQPVEISSVTLIDGTRSVALQDNTPASHSRFGVPISKQYFTFRGRKAAVRTTNTQAVFEFLASAGANISSDVYLFKFDVRSDRREIRVAKGSGGLAEIRIPQDHLIAASIEEIGVGPSSTKRYRLKPNAALRPGEYCLAQGITSFYDFGVD